MREQDRGMDGCKVVTSWGQGSGHTQHSVVISGQAHSRLGGLALCPLAESESTLGRMAHPRVLWVRSRGRGPVVRHHVWFWRGWAGPGKPVHSFTGPLVCLW